MKRSHRRTKVLQCAIDSLEPRRLLSVTPVITTLDGVAHANGSTIYVQAGIALQVRAVNNLTVDNTNTSYALSGGSVFTGASNPNNTHFSWNFGDNNAITDPDYVNGIRSSYPTLVGFNAAHVYDLRTAGTTDYTLTLTATDQAGNVTTCSVTVAVTDGPQNTSAPAAQIGSSASDVESEPTYNGVTYDRIIFVDSVNGSNSYNGFAPTFQGGTTGPVATFGKAISMIDGSGASDWQIRLARGETFDTYYGDLPSGGLITQNVIIGAYGNTSLPRPVLDYDYADAGAIFTFGPSAANWTIQDINFGNITATAYAETANGNVITPQGSNITMRDCSYVGNFADGIITVGSDAIDGLLIQDVNDNGHWFDGPATESNGNFNGSGGYEIALGLGAGAINDVEMVGDTFTGASLNPQEVEGSNGGSGHQPFIRIQPALDDANNLYTSGGRFLLTDNVIEPQNCNGAALTFKGFSYFVYWTGNTFENSPASFGDDLENQIGNGSFDSSTPLTDWTVVTPTVTVETSGAENGANDVQLSSGAELDQTVTNDFASEATYVFSAYVEASSASSLQIGVKNFSGGAGNVYTTVVPGTSWEFVSVPFTLGATDHSATVYLKNVGSNPVLADNTSINQSTYNNIWCVVDGNRAVGTELEFRNDELHLTYRNNVVERYSDAGPASFQESNGYGTVNSTGEGTEDLQLIDNTVYSSYAYSDSVNKLIDLHSDSAVQDVSIVGNLMVEPNVTTNNYQPAINLYSTAAPWLLQDNSNVIEDPSNNGGVSLVGVGASDTPQNLSTWNSSGAGERPSVNSNYAASQYNDIAANVTIANDPSTLTSTAALNVTSADVISPDMAMGVVGVHDIAKIPEAVPAALFDLGAVIVDIPIEPVFEGGRVGSGAVGEIPDAAEEIAGMIMLGGADEDGWGGDGIGHLNETLARGDGGECPEHQFAGAGDAVGGAVAGLVIFVGDFQALELLGVGVHAHAFVIEAQVHGGGAGGPEPEGNLRRISSDPFCVDYFTRSLATDPRTLAARAFALSDADPYFCRGSAAEGTCSPHGEPHHHGKGWIWPLGIIARAMTSTDDAEITRCLAMLKNSTAGTGFMHESFNMDDPSQYTRHWFAWVNNLYGELIEKLLKERPQILAKPFPPGASLPSPRSKACGKPTDSNPWVSPRKTRFTTLRSRPAGEQLSRRPKPRTTSPSPPHPSPELPSQSLQTVSSLQVPSGSRSRRATSVHPSRRSTEPLPNLSVRLKIDPVRSTTRRLQK